MSHKHLAQQFAEALTTHNVALFNEFIHPDYVNHNAYAGPGRQGVKELFTSWLAAFPDTVVTAEAIYEDGDTVIGRFTYRGTFTRPFMGYAPTGQPVEMRSIDIWRVQDEQFIEHWDELNTAEFFQQLGTMPRSSEEHLAQHQAQQPAALPTSETAGEALTEAHIQ